MACNLADYNLRIKSFENLTVNFGVSVAILLGVANSSQTSIKYDDLACNTEPPLEPLLKNFKDLTMILEAKYLFPTSSSVAKF